MRGARGRARRGGDGGAVWLLAVVSCGALLAGVPAHADAPALWVLHDEATVELLPAVRAVLAPVAWRVNAGPRAATPEQLAQALDSGAYAAVAWLGRAPGGASWTLHVRLAGAEEQTRELPGPTPLRAQEAAAAAQMLWTMLRARTPGLGGDARRARPAPQAAPPARARPVRGLTGPLAAAEPVSAAGGAGEPPGVPPGPTSSEPVSPEPASPGPSPPVEAETPARSSGAPGGAAARAPARPPREPSGLRGALGGGWRSDGARAAGAELAAEVAFVGRHVGLGLTAGRGARRQHAHPVFSGSLVETRLALSVRFPVARLVAHPGGLMLEPRVGLIALIVDSRQAGPGGVAGEISALRDVVPGFAGSVLGGWRWRALWAGVELGADALVRAPGVAAGSRGDALRALAGGRLRGFALGWLGVEL